MSAPLEVECRRLGADTVVKLRGELDRTSRGQIEARLCDADPAGRLVVDLGELGYIDSAGIALLDSLHRGWDLRLVVPESSHVSKVLRITGVDAFIPVFAAVDAALITD